MTVELVGSIVVVLMMVIVGTDIRVAQFTDSLRNRRALVGGTLGQLLCLPVLAVLLIWLLQPSPALAGALLLVAVSPTGVMSNFYAAFARLNAAFSVVLTTLSGLVALAAMPLLFASLVPVALGVEAFRVPVAEMMARLLQLLLLPVAAGMLLRHLFPLAVERRRQFLRLAGLFLLALFLALVFSDQRHAVDALFREALLLTISFTLLALLAGWLSGRMLGLNSNDRVVLAIVFGVRNVGIAALLGLTTLQQPEYAVFGAFFVLLQAPLLIIALMLRGRIARSRQAGARVG
jgi:bile acid:Na+ symporter, BASS family